MSRHATTTPIAAPTGAPITAPRNGLFSSSGSEVIAAPIRPPASHPPAPAAAMVKILTNVDGCFVDVGCAA